MLNRRTNLKPAQLCWWASAVASLALAAPIPAQTTQPASRPTTGPAGAKSHQDLLREAARPPLIKERLTTPDGKPLNDEQLAELVRADKLMQSAEEARPDGRYAEALKAAEEALGIRRQILGEAHHRTIDAAVLEAAVRKITAAPADDQKRLAEADRAQVEAMAAFDKGQYAQTEKLSRQALAVREQFLGKDSPDAAESLLWLAKALTELRELKEAEAALERAVKITEAAQGRNHPQMAILLDRLGWLRINQGQYEEATKAFGTAVKIFRTTVGETVETAEALDNFGTALSSSLDREKALQYKLRAYVVRERLLGSEAQDTAVSLSNLAWLYGEIGGPLGQEVIPLRQRALAIFEKALGPEHPYTNLEAMNLARVYQVRNMPEEALKLYERAVTLDLKKPDNFDDRTVDRRIVLGEMYLQMNRLEEGLQAMQQAYDLCLQLEARGEVRAAVRQLSNLAYTYHRRRIFDDAIKAHEKILELAKKAPEKASQETVDRAVGLGTVYLEAGRTEDAERVLEQAVAECKEQFGDDALENGAPMLALCKVYTNAGRLDEAEEICEQALQISEKKLAMTARGRAYALHAMGLIQTRQKRYDMAKFSLESAREIFDRPENRRRDSAAIISLTQDLAECYLGSGKREDALELYRKAIQDCRTIGNELKGARANALLAESLKKLLDALSTVETPQAQKECDEIKQELRQLLEQLKTARALSANNKKWLEELGDVGPKS